MKSRNVPVMTIVASLAALGGMALAAQDKYTVQVPGGLAFSEFRGYEDWQAVAVSQPEDKLNLILANPVMIDAYRAGVPGNGKPFPDGSKIAKIAWNSQQNAESPFSVNVPDTLAGVGFIVKDSTRFSDTGGWGYAQFDYDPRLRHVHAQYIVTGERRQVRGRVPFDSGGERLHFHRIREEVSGEQELNSCRTDRRGPLAPAACPTPVCAIREGRSAIQVQGLPARP
jgi:Cytochrome P460